MLSGRLRITKQPSLQGSGPAAALSATWSRRLATIANVASVPKRQLNNKMATAPRQSGSGMPNLGSGEDFRITENISANQFPANLRKNCVLFYTPETEELAKKIAAVGGDNITLGKIRWK